MQPSLVTIVTVQQATTLSKIWLQRYMDKWEECDVQNKSFVEGFILATSSPQSTISPDALVYLKGLGNRWVDVIVEDGFRQTFAPGPYLYDDEQQAFLTAVKPNLGM